MNSATAGTLAFGLRGVPPRGLLHYSFVFGSKRPRHTSSSEVGSPWEPQQRSLTNASVQPHWKKMK
jgi:hypothetical protein